MRSAVMVAVCGLVICACSAPAVRPVPPPVAPAEPVLLDPPEPGLRLPKHFAPAGYAARLAIDPARAEFTGAIEIAGTLSARSAVIWLHARGLTIQRAVARRAGAEVALTATPHDEVLELRPAAPLDAGRWTLALDYTGRFDDLNTAGAFKQVVHGEPYIYTQLEAVYARRVFPCIDEPDTKVPWQLTLDVPAGQVALANTAPVRQQPLDDQHVRVEFAPTRPLPSYLVAFAVGPFELVDAGATSHGAPIRVATAHGRARDGAWAAKTAPRIIELLEAFFGSPYPYDKLDLVAMPVTIGFGAMENAGLVTFADPLILLPDHAGKHREYEWVVTASHELGHQWFGDLVTTAWWDDIWLNEGFANWVERKISVQFEPAWHDELAELTERNRALADDALVTARQIRQPITTADDILNAFDSITYNKGASVLNMFEHHVGHDAFIAGVRTYIKDHAFGNATSEQLVAAIGRAAGRPIGPAFASFLEQPGAPQITASLQCDRRPRVELHQERYVPPGAAAPLPGKPWIVPVCLAYDRGGQRAEACGVLAGETGVIQLDAPSCPAWLMPNVGGRGYYRSAYSEDDVVALRDQAWPMLTPAERGAVMFDVSEAATLGALPLPLALSFVPRLLVAGDRFSVAAATAIPRAIDELVPGELRPVYEAWLRQTYSAVALQAGVVASDRDSLDLETSRGELLDAAGELGREPKLAAQAIKLAAKWRDLPPAIRGQVLAIAAHASPAIYQRALREVVTEEDRVRRRELLDALATTRDPAPLRTALALLLDPRLDIRDTQLMFEPPMLEPSRLAAQQFFRDHQAELLKRVPLDSPTGGAASIASLFTDSCSAARRDELAGYVTATFSKLPGGSRMVTQAIETMDQCIARRAAVEPAIRAWLAGLPPVTERRGR